MSKPQSELEKLPAKCPWCGEDLIHLGFRQFGPQGIFAAVLHSEEHCMKVVGTIAVPIIPGVTADQSPRSTTKSPIITPKQ